MTFFKTHVLKCKTRYILVFCLHLLRPLKAAAFERAPDLSLKWPDLYALHVLLKIDAGDSLHKIYFHVVFENELKVILAREKVSYAKMFCDYVLFNCYFNDLAF